MGIFSESFWLGEVISSSDNHLSIPFYLVNFLPYLLPSALCPLPSALFLASFWTEVLLLLIT